MNDLVFVPTVGMIHLQQDLPKKCDYVEMVLQIWMLMEAAEQMAHFPPSCAFDRVVSGDTELMRNASVLSVDVHFHFVVQLKI